MRMGENGLTTSSEEAFELDRNGVSEVGTRCLCVYQNRDTVHEKRSKRVVVSQGCKSQKNPHTNREIGTFDDEPCGCDTGDKMSVVVRLSSGGE